eukprot:CAMPEP_0201691540 /NCGR_PEP_ID=MMETSP0578-20130828/4687_1 /ASSEMBLY_ACC=CAM_ASM_000663 /TAXON_ID=267565 /ORGANISM="Skeletonema grethea, Strain CCMP 1804" /LENGTH=81 /DNA_ID=CAMNT_0048176771 /DNA_START=99 /DNA_END=340 /DNA_ORIENTATION=-
MTPSQRRRQRHSQEHQYADDITIGSQSDISALTTGTTATMSTFSTVTAADSTNFGTKRRNTHPRRRIKDNMSTINDDEEDG